MPWPNLPAFKLPAVLRRPDDADAGTKTEHPEPRRSADMHPTTPPSLAARRPSVSAGAPERATSDPISAGLQKLHSDYAFVLGGELNELVRSASKGTIVFPGGISARVADFPKRAVLISHPTGNRQFAVEYPGFGIVTSIKDTTGKPIARETLLELVNAEVLHPALLQDPALFPLLQSDPDFHEILSIDHLAAAKAKKAGQAAVQAANEPKPVRTIATYEIQSQYRSEAELFDDGSLSLTTYLPGESSGTTRSIRNISRDQVPLLRTQVIEEYFQSAEDRAHASALPLGPLLNATLFNKPASEIESTLHGYGITLINGRTNLPIPRP